MVVNPRTSVNIIESSLLSPPSCNSSGFFCSLATRSGERYASALTKISNNRKIINKYGKIDLKDYVTSFIKGEKL